MFIALLYVIVALVEIDVYIYLLLVDIELHASQHLCTFH